VPNEARIEDRMRAVDLIARKRDGGEIARADLRALILGYASGEVPDYQMAAFLMAGYLRGFTRREAEALTEAMVASGATLDLSRIQGRTVDKHSTGGVADATTLIVGPLVAALGLKMLKLSGRGLGHTGGTLDKLESIPGFKVERSAAELLDQVDRVGLAIAAQSADLVPADKAMYALRGVTATVASTALIAASVMSKKLAGGASCILLDVKTGSGAFMKDPSAAASLAGLCVEIGRAAGRRSAALVSDMSQPLGDLIGNAVEVREAVEVLRGERGGRLLDLCLTLAGQLLVLAGAAPHLEAGRERARYVLDGGHGLEKFREFVAAQGGDPAVCDDPAAVLPAAPLAVPVHADASGFLTAVDAEAVGWAAAALGAGRQRKDDPIDPAVAIELPTKLGDRVEIGQPLATIHARTQADAERAEAALRAALRWSDQPSPAPPLVHQLLGP
jgi:pyrimidine-nucleoside phosphorylase